MRSRSSYQAGASAARVRRVMRTTSAARRPVRTSASSAASSTGESSRYASTNAASVAGCAATVANIPGASANTARTAAASTGVDTGRRCAAASRGAPISSASRYAVRKVTPATPVPSGVTRPSVPPASNRRAATPT